MDCASLSSALDALLDHLDMADDQLVSWFGTVSDKLTSAGCQCSRPDGMPSLVHTSLVRGIGPWLEPSPGPAPP